MDQKGVQIREFINDCLANDNTQEELKRPTSRLKKTEPAKVRRLVLVQREMESGRSLVASI
jgi:hypothetical protein